MYTWGHFDELFMFCMPSEWVHLQTKCHAPLASCFKWKQSFVFLHDGLLSAWCRVSEAWLKFHFVSILQGWNIHIPSFIFVRAQMLSCEWLMDSMKDWKGAKCFNIKSNWGDRCVIITLISTLCALLYSKSMFYSRWMLCATSAFTIPVTFPHVHW